MKMVIRAVGIKEPGSSGQVLAELDLAYKIEQADQDFLRAKLELAFAELIGQEVVARFDYEEQAQGPGMIFQPRSGINRYFMPNEDALEHVFLAPTGELRMTKYA